MNTLITTLLVVVAALLVAGAFAAWFTWKYPSRVWNLATRQALRRIPLAKVVVPSPAGPQTAFLGGTGPLLVFLHGAGHQAGTWSQAAAALAKDHTLLIPDLAGHGDSAPATGPIDASQIVDGLEAVLAVHCRGRKATLVGNSLGGWMAFVVASRHPEWVEKVVGVNGGPLDGMGDVNLLPASREEARTTMARLRDPASPAIPVNVLDELVHRSRTSPLARFASTAATMGAWNLSEAQLATLKVPADLVWGLSDGLMPMAYVQRMLSSLPGARLFQVDRCGHVPQNEAPDRFLEALRKALP